MHFKRRAMPLRRASDSWRSWSRSCDISARSAPRGGATTVSNRSATAVNRCSCPSVRTRRFASAAAWLSSSEAVLFARPETSLSRLRKVEAYSSALPLSSMFGPSPRPFASPSTIGAKLPVVSLRNIVSVTRLCNSSSRRACFPWSSVKRASKCAASRAEFALCSAAARRDACSSIDWRTRHRRAVWRFAMASDVADARSDLCC
mmetsp:Transcript_1915/g.5986  ORF Transcript_1915/g.5986 Transcript_1915/m.5986 type:complete len:204 (-) Transcript_1915:587-1198(-)